MANEKITAMPDGSPILSGDMFPFARSGDPTNYSATAAEIATYAGANVTVGAGKLFGNPGTVSAPGSDVTPDSFLTLQTTGELKARIASVYYLNNSVRSDIAGYQLASRVPSLATETTIVTALAGTAVTTIASFLTPFGVPNGTAFPAANALRRIYASVDASGTSVANLTIRTRILHIDGTLTTVNSASSADFSNTTVALVDTSVAGPANAIVMVPTDRIVFEVRVNRVSGPATVTLTTYYDGTAHKSFCETPVISGVGADYIYDVCKDFGAVGNALSFTDGTMTAGSAVLISQLATFSVNDEGKTFCVSGALGSSSPPLLATLPVGGVTNSHTITLSGTASATTGIQFYAAADVVNGGTSGFYSPGVDTISLTGGTFSVQAVATVVSTTVRPDSDTFAAFTINNAGSLGVQGSYVFKGTTGTGPPFRLRGVVGSAGTLESVTFLGGGIYVANPGTTAEPITDSVSGLTGATVAINGIDVGTVGVSVAGVYTVVPDDPVATGAGATSGATGAQLDVSWQSTGQFTYFTDDNTAFTNCFNAANTLGAAGSRVDIVVPPRFYGITGAELPILTQPVRILGGGRDLSEIIAAEGYLGRHIIGFADLFPTALTDPANGKVATFSKLPYGGGVVGLSVQSNLLNTNLPDGFVVYNRCSNMAFTNIGGRNVGSGFRAGVINGTSATQAFLRESELDDLWFSNCGTTARPVFWLDSLGSASGCNFLHIGGLNVVFPQGPGIVLTNHTLGKRRSVKTIYFDKPRVERHPSSAGVLGDLFQIGSTTDTEAITNIYVNQPHLVAPPVNTVGLSFYGVTERTRPQDIVVDGVLMTGPGLGIGLGVYAGFNLYFTVDNLTARTVQIATGNHAPLRLPTATVGVGSTTGNVVTTTGSGTTDAYVGAAAVWTVPASITASQSGTTVTVTVVGSGRLMVGTILTGNSLQPQKKITAFGSGTGGTGTYTVSNSQTLTSRAMTGIFTEARNITAWNAGTKTATIGALQGSAATWSVAPTSGDAISFQSLVDADLFINGYGQEKLYTYSDGVGVDALWTSPVLGSGVPTGAQTIATNLVLTGTAGLTLGAVGVVTGKELFIGSTSGTITIQPQAAAGTWSWLWPITAGTTGQVLVSQAGTAALTWATPTTGTVTSVAESFTGGLISVAGSPITGAGTLALTVAGTSGGIPYFSGATTWASSGALTASAIVFGGGAGATPATGLGLGTTTTLLHGNAAGLPTWAAVSLTADVSGLLPLANIAAISAGVVSSNGTILQATTLSGASFSGSTLTIPPRTPGIMVELTGTLAAGTYDLGPCINGGTVLNSYAHVASGTLTYTGAIGAPGTYTAITGLTAITSSTTTVDTIGTATAANTLSAGQHLFLQVGTGAVGGSIFFAVKTP